DQLLIVRELGMQLYVPVWQAMQTFTDERQADTPDELWLLQHEPVFTQGQAGKAEHLLFPGQIPVVQVDRGGQVTYHGPGQLVGYLLFDIGRRGMGSRELVSRIEEALGAAVAHYGVTAQARGAGRGGLVGDAKTAALGVRVR